MSKIAEDIFDEAETEIGDIFDDIFDEVEKRIEKNSLLKEFIPPKVVRLELTHQIIDLIKDEISKRVKVKEAPKPELNEEKVISIISGSILKMSGQVKENHDRMIAKFQEENRALRSEMDEIRKAAPVGIVRNFSRNYPHPSGKTGQFLTNDGTKWEWGQLYGDTENPSIPIGDPNVDGSWRIIVVGTDLSIQKREAGVWNEKGAHTP